MVGSFINALIFLSAFSFNGPQRSLKSFMSVRKLGFTSKAWRACQSSIAFMIFFTGDARGDIEPLLVPRGVALPLAADCAFKSAPTDSIADFTFGVGVFNIFKEVMSLRDILYILSLAERHSASAAW